MPFIYSLTTNIYKLKIIFLYLTCLFAQEADHLLLIRIVTQPSEAEAISIYNPTSSPINLANYYISDSEDYYKIQTDGDLSPSSSISGFTVRFPNITIDSDDTLNIALNENYINYYGDDFVAHLTMFGSDENSMLETEDGSIGFSNNKLNDASELIILFEWDGISSSLINDIDYFLWGSYQTPINKSSISTYLDDTQEDDQYYFESPAGEYYGYHRIDINETEETQTNGNGLTANDETNENFRLSWEIRALFNMGCTDENALNYDPYAVIDDENCSYDMGCTDEIALNYDPYAVIDDENCLYNFIDIIDNCYYEEVICDGQYDLLTPGDCPLYSNKVSLIGTVVDFYDITPSNGPFSFKIEDDSGYRISFVIWPSNSTYQDGFNILHTDLSMITNAPFNRFLVQIKGTLDVYCRSALNLDVYNDWQVVVEYESDLVIVEESDKGGFFTSDSTIDKVTINPEPYVIIPSLGETLDFTFSHPKNSRVLIRIFDLSGRFITSLLDDYIIEAGTWSNGYNPSTDTNSQSSSWHGRDHLGQIVPPGTYIMHIEAMNPHNGQTYTDSAPIVVGVKN